MKWWAVTFAALSVVLGSCATPTSPADEEASRLLSERDRAYAIAGTCTRSMLASDAYQPLKGKLAPFGENVTMEAMTDGRKPTAQDAANLLVWHRDQLAPCRVRILEALGRVHPSYVAVFGKAYASYDASYAQLIRRTITWGDFAGQYSQQKQTAQVEAQQVNSSLRQELVQAARYEQQQRQAAAAALQQWSAQQQILNQQQRVGITNCSYVGMTLSCVSY